MNFTPWQAVEERRDRIAELTRQGLSAAIIADMLHITPRTVVRARQRRGIPNPQHRMSLTSAQIKFAKALLDDGASYNEVGRTLGCSHQTIRRLFPGYEYTRAQVVEASMMARMMARIERGDK